MASETLFQYLLAALINFVLKLVMLPTEHSHVEPSTLHALTR